MRAVTRVYSGYLIMALIGLLAFSGCVKKHKDKIGSATNYYAITELNPSDTNVRTDNGEPVKVLGQGTYFVQDDYVGCRPASGAVGSLAADGKEVVTLSTGQKAACVEPSSLAKMKVRPEVTFFKAPSTNAFTIYTRGVIRTSGRTESPEGVKVDGDIGIQVLDVVDYTAPEGSLLHQVKDKISLRAKPYSEYKAYYKITPTHLFIMKVGDQSELSHMDLPIADNLGNGQFAVPIASVPLTLYNYRARKNSDGEKTNVYEFHKVENLKTATHINFNPDNIKEMLLPQSLVKDVYPADYFTEGMWYMSESVVDTRPGSEGSIGTNTGAYDKEFREASKVRFTRTSTGLIACNIGVDERFAEDKTCSKSASVIDIQASNHAFAIKKGENTVSEINVIAQEAPFVRLRLTKHSTIKKSFDQLRSFSSLEPDQLLSLNFSKEKFSFTVQRGANGRQVMYSFLKAESRPKYNVRRHYKDDREKRFGYFVQEVSKLRAGEEVEREEDLEKDYLVQRHNPNEDIYFYFSSLTPDYANEKDPFGTNIDYRDLGQKAVDYWNAAFERAGATNRIVLIKEDEKTGKPYSVPYGDISYNTINLVDSEKGSNLLGVGPSLTDPYTGEVVNTNANVYIAPFRSIVARSVRDFIKSELGYYEGPSANLPESALENSTLLGDMADADMGVKDMIASLIPDRVMTMVANFYHFGFAGFDARVPDLAKNSTYYANNGDDVADLYELANFNEDSMLIKSLVHVAERIPELRYLEQKERITFNVKTRKDLYDLKEALRTHRPGFYASYFTSEAASGFNELNSMTRQIKEECSEVVALVSRVKARTEKGQTPVITSEEELPAVRHCMSKVIPGKFLATLVHEMGHNLGLRHNFLGSTDKENFYTKEEVKEIFDLDLRDQDLPRSSTVMEYIKTQQDRLYFPGHYDIAAIRYAYADKVEVESDSAKRPNTPEGEYVSLTSGRDGKVFGSIVDELAQKGKTLKPYSYCTDIEAILEVDPMCARHDFGVTPSVVVEDAINSFWEHFTLYNFRYDRVNSSVTGPFRRMGMVKKLKRMYDEWRVLLANHLGKTDSTGNVYLQRYSAEEYTEVLKSLKADPNFEGKEYLEVRDRIFDFMMEVSFFPNKYCLLETPAGYKAFEFTKLRDELRNQVPKGTKIASCDHPKMQEVIAGKGYKYIFEGGTPVDNIWYYVNPEDTFKEDIKFRSFRAPLDQVGTFLDRFFTAQLMSVRQSGFNGLLENAFPNMLDEPDLYERFEKAVVARVTQGVELKEAIGRPNDIDFPADFSLRLPNFDAEAGMIKALWLTLEQGVNNPFVDSSERASRFGRFFTDDVNQINNAQQNGGFVLPMASGRALIIPASSVVPLELAKSLSGISQTFQAANQQIPTADQIVGSLKPLAAAMSESLGGVNDPALIEPAKYLEFARLVMANFPQMDPFQQQVVQNIYIADMMPYLVFLAQADGAIAQAQAQGVEPPPAAVEFLEKTLADWAVKGMPAVAAETKAVLAQQGQNAEVTVPTSEGVLKAYDATAPAIAKQMVEQATAEKEKLAAHLEVHGDELFAQYELIRSILVYDFGEFGQEINLKIAELLGDSNLNNLLLSGNPAGRALYETHLNPTAVAKAKLGLELPFEKVKALDYK